MDLGDVDVGIAECQNNLIGKVMGEKVANYTGIKNFVTTAWGFPKDMKVVELGPNLFQFIIPSLEAREKIVNGGPWNFDNQPLVLSKLV